MGCWREAHHRAFRYKLPRQRSGVYPAPAGGLSLQSLPRAQSNHEMLTNLSSHHGEPAFGAWPSPHYENLLGIKYILKNSYTFLQSTAEAELTADTAGFNELAQLLKADKSETIKLGGTFSKTPVAFKVTAYFHTTITAGVL